jgi:hypothetical protein
MAYGSPVRPRKLVAGAALTAALALVALPGLAGSWTPTQVPAIRAAAFNDAAITTDDDADSAAPPRALDAAHRSAGFLAADSAFLEPGEIVAAAPAGRASVDTPAVAAGSALKPPRATFSGYASFYDHGTTALRLPRGTLVIICGNGGCIERRVTDYGPNARVHPERVADLYRPDFFRICGCPSWSGTAWVTVKVY